MAFDCYLAENFMEWPAATMVGTYSGTGWGPLSGNAPNVVANTNYHSGKCLRWVAANSLSADFSFPAGIPLGLPWGLQFNFIRQADASVDPTDQNAGVGLMLVTGTANHWLRIVLGSTGVGLQNSWYLQSRSGATGTFTTLAISENKYLLGTKHAMSINVDWTTGAFEWWIDDTLVYSGTSVAFAGVTPTALRWGRMATGAGSGSCDIGDIILASDYAYNGPLEVRGGFPTANDALQDWAFVGGASAWESINNTYTVTPTEYIESSAAAEISDFVCPIDSTEVVTILAVSVEYYAVRTAVSAIDMEARIGQGVSFTGGATENPPQAAYEKFRDFFNVLNPNTGVNWVPADLPANLAGVERTS